MPNTNNEEARCCEYCGAALEPIELQPMFRGTGGRFPSVVFYKACTCAQAKAALKKAEEEEAAAKAEAERQARERAYKRARIPKRYWNAELDDKGAMLYGKVRNGQGLFLTGKSGRGKTYTACAILRRLIEDGYRNVKFADIEGIEREVTASWGNRDENEAAIIARYVNAEVCVIDDLGAEELTAVTMKVLRAVVSGREANDAVTIFTSNYSRRDFALHVGAKADKVMASRLASRISGMTEMVTFEGEDRRLCRE